MGRNFYRAVKTNQNSKSRNRQQVVQSNQPPPPTAFEVLDTNNDGVVSESEINSAIAILEKAKKTNQGYQQQQLKQKQKQQIA